MSRYLTMDDGSRVLLRDLGILETGASIGLDPVSIREVREECNSDAEAARRLGCSSATVARARKDGEKGRDAVNPWDRLYGRADVDLLEKVGAAIEDIGGTWSTGALAVYTGASEAEVRRILDLYLATDIVQRAPGMGWKRGNGRAPLDDLRKQVTFARYCPKDKSHGFHAARYCPVCKARLAPRGAA